MLRSSKGQQDQGTGSSAPPQPLFVAPVPKRGLKSERKSNYAPPARALVPCWSSARSHRPESYRWLLWRCPAGQELPGHGGLVATSLCAHGGDLGASPRPRSHLLLVPAFPAGNGYVSARASPGLLPVSNGSTLGKIIPAKSPPPPPPAHGAQLAANSRKPDLRVITSQSGKGLMHHLVSLGGGGLRGAGGPVPGTGGWALPRGVCGGGHGQRG